MLIDFGNNKCPLCGSSGNRLSKDIMVCRICGTPFHDFGFIPLEPYEVGMWWN